MFSKSKLNIKCFDSFVFVVFDCFREPKVALVRSLLGSTVVRSLSAFLNTYWCYKVNGHGVSAGVTVSVPVTRCCRVTEEPDRTSDPDDRTFVCEILIK